MLNWYAEKKEVLSALKLGLNYALKNEEWEDTEKEINLIKNVIEKLENE